MRTGHQFCTDIRPEFSGSESYGAWADEIGSIDAPSLICAGGYERVKAQFFGSYYPLPIVIKREQK